jgi:hypothetical protein
VYLFFVLSPYPSRACVVVVDVCVGERASSLSRTALPHSPRRCILYELAMLRSPFKEEGLSLFGLFQKITKGEYPPIADVYSVELRELTSAMLQLDPAARPDIEVGCTLRCAWWCCCVVTSCRVTLRHPVPCA